MPTINIRDNAGIDILTADSGPGSGFSKYFKGDTAGFLASAELAQALNKPIATLTPAPLGFGFSTKETGHFGTSGADWTLDAGASVALVTALAGQTIPGDRIFANPLTAPEGTTYAGIRMSPRLSFGVSADMGDLTFGFSAGQSFEFQSGRTFPIEAGNGPSVAAALQDILKNCAFPGDFDDLKAMEPGDLVSAGGSGSFKVSGSFDVAQAINPLATPVLGLSAIGALHLDAGAKLSIGAKATITGKYQIRVFKVDENRIHVGLYKMNGTQFGFDVKATAAVSGSLGTHELTEKLMKLLGTPQADVQNLVDGGLSADQVHELKDAIEASLSRTIALSLAGSFAASSDKTTVFEYEFDLTKIGAEGSEALHRALDADFSPLTTKLSTELPPGVAMLASEFDTVSKRSITWRINLLGIVNVLHVTSLVKEGKALFDVDTGELTVTDTATAKEIFAVSNSLQRQQRVRRLLMQSAVLTAAYHATGADRTLGFEGAVTYFDSVANATPQNLSDFLDNLTGLLLITEAKKQEFLAQFLAGRASVLAEVQFTKLSFDRMFTDKNGKPHKADHYDLIGRLCVAQLIQPGDPDSFRRTPMVDDALWKTMSDGGQPNFPLLLPAPLNDGVPLQLIIHDYTVIKWWSAAMSTAAERVADMKTFLATTSLDAEALKDNKTFVQKRRGLHDALAKAVKEATPEFLGAWGVLAMYAAAGRLADVRGIVLTDGPVLFESRPAPLAATA